jgi:hypothetical protein
LSPISGEAGWPQAKLARDPLASFVTNPAGAAIVTAIGPIRQLVQGKPEPLLLDCRTSFPIRDPPSRPLQ